MKTNKGFTLIELLITLVISSVLTIGVFSIFLGFKESYRVQSAMSDMMEDARYMLELLGTEIRRVGFLRNRLVADENVVFLTDNNILGSSTDLAQGEFMKGQADGTFFDTVVFRYQLNDSTELSAVNPNFTSSPCTQDVSLTVGEDPAVENHVATIRLFVEFDNGLNMPVLKCAAKRDNLSDPSKSRVSADKTLMLGVEAMRIVYGVDTDGDNLTNFYLQQNQVTNWNDVVSLRLSLVLGTSERNVSKTVPTYTYDGNVYNVSSPDDGRVYRVFSTTLTLRNFVL